MTLLPGLLENEEASAETPAQKPLDASPFSILSCRGFKIPGPLSCQKVLSLVSHFPAVVEGLPIRAVLGEKSSPREAFGLGEGETNLLLVTVLQQREQKGTPVAWLLFITLLTQAFAMRTFMQVCVWSAPHASCCVFRD